MTKKTKDHSPMFDPQDPEDRDNEDDHGEDDDDWDQYFEKIAEMR